MKTSMYNWLTKDEHSNVYIMYNGYTGAIIEVEEFDDIVLMKNIINIGDNKACDDLYNVITKKQRSVIEKCGIVIENSRDELNELKVLSNVSRYRTSIGAMTVVPTQECNFACPYCYQGDSTASTSVISEEVIQRIAEVAACDTGDEFHIALYGGEPLLAWVQCKSLLSAVKTSIEKRGARLTTSIVTNGYLLNDEVIDTLATYNLINTQITLDGTEEQHNSRRFLRNGDKTYQTIVQNIKRAAMKNITVSVRVNIENTAINAFTDLQREFEGIEEVRLHPAPTTYYHIEQKRRSYANRKYVSDCIVVQRKSDATNARILGCISTTLKGMVIMPDGNMLRCWSEVGQRNISYGNILNESQPDLCKSTSWLAWDPYSRSSKCGLCKKLPQCGGGCPYHRLTEGETYCRFMSDESYSKFILSRYNNIKGSDKVDNEGGQYEDNTEPNRSNQTGN